MTTGIVSHDHPAWEEFLDRLEGPEGCDFTEGEPGNVDSITWRCAGGMDKTYATAILRNMQNSYPDIDVEASLAYYNENGGHCDCEILFNVPRGSHAH